MSTKKSKPQPGMFGNKSSPQKGTKGQGKSGGKIPVPPGKGVAPKGKGKPQK